MSNEINIPHGIELHTIKGQVYILTEGQGALYDSTRENFDNLRRLVTHINDESVKEKFDKQIIQTAQLIESLVTRFAKKASVHDVSLIRPDLDMTSWPAKKDKS